MPAKPKGGKLSCRFVSETACIGLPFRHCRWYYSITFARFLYIPRTYRVHTRSCTKNHAVFMHFLSKRKRCCFPDLCKGFKPYCDGSGCRVCLCKAHLSGGLLTGLTLNITQDDALAAADGCRVSIQQICRINGRLLHLHILALEGSQLFLCFHNGPAPPFPTLSLVPERPGAAERWMWWR